MSQPTGPQETPETPGTPDDAPGVADPAAPEAAAGQEQPAADPGQERQSGPTFRDRRRIDPHTGAPRTTAGGPAAPGDGPAAQEGGPQDPVFAAKVSEMEEMVAERTADLQRLQAEYANYKKRVDRDRGLSKTAGIEAVVLDLLPVLDSIEAAREHEELVGGFKLVADELEKVAAKYGLEVFGEVGEAFDPHVHEALMHMPWQGEDEITETTISAIIQKGVRLNERVLRPARVAVADPS